MALVVFGATRQPGMGVFSSLAALDAGERTGAWNLAGVLTNRYSRIYTGVGTLVLNGAGLSGGTAALSQLGMLKHGELLNCWVMIDTDRFRPLPAEWLAAVSDGMGVNEGAIDTQIYDWIIRRAYQTSLNAFAKAARKDVTYGHVMADPAFYRGKVVHFEGRLLSVNREKPPLEAREAGVSDLYVAWVGNAELGSNPFRLDFTTWPKGLSTDLLGQPTIKEPIRVALDGYFFKTYPYKDRRGRERTTALVIGHGLVVISNPPPTRSSTLWINMLLGAFVTMVAGLIVGVIGLTYWYRRNDNRMRKRLLARMPEFVLPPPDTPPVAPPVAPAVKPVNGHNAPAIAHRPRITFPAGSASKADDGGTSEQQDKPSDEGAAG
jgi:hypothetical protein